MDDPNKLNLEFLLIMANIMVEYLLALRVPVVSDGPCKPTDTCSMAFLGLGFELASGSSMQDPIEAADRGD